MVQYIIGTFVSKGVFSAKTGNFLAGPVPKNNLPVPVSHIYPVSYTEQNASKIVGVA